MHNHPNSPTRGGGERERETVGCLCSFTCDILTTTNADVGIPVAGFTQVLFDVCGGLRVEFPLIRTEQSYHI